MSRGEHSERAGEFARLQRLSTPEPPEFPLYRYNSEEPANIYVSFNVSSKHTEMPAILCCAMRDRSTVMVV